MELEVGAKTGAGFWRAVGRPVRPSATLSRPGLLRRGQAWSSCASRSCAKARTSHAREGIKAAVAKLMLIRLVGAILLEQNDEWAVQRARYKTLETMATLSDDAIVGLPAMVI